MEQNDIGYYRERKILIDKMLRLARQALIYKSKTPDGWVIYEQRKPMEEGFYLVTCVTKTGEQWVTILPYLRGKFGGNDTQDKMVTHWRNKPMPPAKEGE